MIGTGTGAAPLYGILRDALHNGHEGKIHFYHGCRHVESLYLDAELSVLQRDNPNFYYYPSVTAEQAIFPIRHGRCSSIALENIEQYKQARFYLCGDADMVTATKKRLYLAGISLKNIYTDAFEYKELRTAPRM